MNIGFVSTWNKRGTKYQTKFLAEHILHKHQLFFFFYKKIEFEKDEKKQLNYTFKKSPKIKYILKWAIQKKLDVIFFIDKQDDYLDLELFHKKGIKTITTIMYEEITQNNLKELACFSYVLCPVKCTYDLLREKGLSNLVFIRWGVDSQWVSRSSVVNLRKEIFFLFNAGWGGVQWRKNPLAVVEAFDIASKSDDSIYLMFKTQLPVKKYETEVQEIIKNNQNIIVIEDNLSQAQLMSLYSKCSVSLLPSKWEGIGIPFLESLAMGLPVITVDSPPMNEWVLDGDNGYCCKLAREETRKTRAGDEKFVKAIMVDTEDLAQKILLLADRDNQLKMSKNAIKSVVDSGEGFQTNLNKFLDSLHY